MRKVEVSSYNKDWPLMYEVEEEKLRDIFGTERAEMNELTIFIFTRRAIMKLNVI